MKSSFQPWLQNTSFVVLTTFSLSLYSSSALGAGSVYAPSVNSVTVEIEAPDAEVQSLTLKSEQVSDLASDLLLSNAYGAPVSYSQALVNGGVYYLPDDTEVWISDNVIRIGDSEAHIDLDNGEIRINHPKGITHASVSMHQNMPSTMATLAIVIMHMEEFSQGCLSEFHSDSYCRLVLILAAAISYVVCVTYGNYLCGQQAIDGCGYGNVREYRMNCGTRMGECIYCCW